MIAFLVLLQLIAPLVHAHVDNSGTMAGLHWQALEKIDASHQITHQIDAPSAIVELESALKSSPSHIKLAIVLFLIPCAILSLLARKPLRVAVLPYATSYFESPPPCARAPRSPPFPG